MFVYNEFFCCCWFILNAFFPYNFFQKPQKTIFIIENLFDQKIFVSPPISCCLYIDEKWISDFFVFTFHHCNLIISNWKLDFLLIFVLFLIIIVKIEHEWKWMKWLTTNNLFIDELNSNVFFYFRWKWIRLICGLLHRYDFIISLLYAYADDNNYFLLESQQINRLNSIDWSLFNLSLKYNDNWISNKWMNERANVWCKLDDFFPMFSRFFFIPHFFKRSISTSSSSCCCWSKDVYAFKSL